MIRTKNNNYESQLDKVNAIFCADFHLRETTPVCRIDNFWEAQWKKVDFISNLQKQYSCPVIHSGDLFEHWKPSPLLLTMAMIHLPRNFMTIYGNHDLPQHSIELAEKCGVYTLWNSGHVKILHETHWGFEPKEGTLLFPLLQEKHLCVWHVLTWKGRLPWPGAVITSAHELLEKYPQFDLILTGHNHKTFVEEVDERLLVNPGSLTRHDADQEDHKPCIFLWQASTNEVEQVFLPIEQNVISREHIEHKEEHDKRISAFIERLNKSELQGFDFKKNLETFERTNKVRQSVMNIVWKAVE